MRVEIAICEVYADTPVGQLPYGGNLMGNIKANPQYPEQAALFRPSQCRDQ